MKNNLLNEFKIFCTLTRSYSLPISVMSWLVPFVYAIFEKGNIFNGIAALIGIIILHLGSNLFDDIVDYSFELIDIRKGKKCSFNFQKGKCTCFIENKVALKQAFIIDLFLFTIATLIGIYYVYTMGLELLYIIILTAILCLLYPILGSRGFGEIIIALIFSPLLYSGVYFVMTGSFSLKILILSISTGLMTVAVLVNHSILDYRYDTTNRKITLCGISGSEKNALLLLFLIILAAYINLIFWILNSQFSVVYLLPFLTLPFVFKIIKEMNMFIKQEKSPDNAKSFLTKFLLVQNLQKYFIILLCISVIIDKFYR